MIHSRSIVDMNWGARLRDEIQKLAFSRHDIYRLLAWPLAAVVSGALLWSVTLSRVEADRQHIEADAFKDASSLSKIYAQQLDRSLEQIDSIALHVKFDWEHAPSALHLKEQSQAGLYPDSGRLYITIVDREGKRVASTLSDDLNGPSLAGRPYFQTHKSAPSVGLLINEPAPGYHTKKSLVRFTRRLNAANGSFNGIVVVSVEPGYLASFVDESSLNKSAFHTARRSDGTLLAAKAGQGSRSLKGTLRSPPVFNKDSGVVRMSGENFTHNQPRILAWQKVAKYPVVAIVGLSEEEIFAPHREMEREYRRFTITGSLFLLLLTIMGVLFSARLAYKKRQADDVKKAYRVATEGTRDGFYMVRPLYDQQGIIVDFLVEDCNEWGASYYGTTRTKLIGGTFSSFWPGAYAQDVIALFRRAMEADFYEDEFRVPPESPLGVTWMHRRLLRSGEGLAVTLRDISALKAHEESLTQLANADAVTTLPNRHWLMNYLPSAIEKARSGSKMLALLFVDLDDFKDINDTLGHAAGDELLRKVAARLRTIIRPQDCVVRLGGDEFTIVLEHVDSIDGASGAAERIITSFSHAFVLSDGSNHLVQASIGISVFPQDGDDGEALLKHADVAMYAAKANGKAHYQFYQPQLSERLVTRLNQTMAMRQAIERDEFVLYYQPRVDTFSGELRSMEALVRWMHPEHGLVSPNDFIPLAEETGLIVPLGELVIKMACAQIAAWKAQGLPVVPVSVNVSSRQFNKGQLSALFQSCMERHDIAPSLIEIEITESCVIGKNIEVTKELAALEALGVALLVDDFGTGYSSLSQLQRLDLDVLKVDRAFTAQLGSNRKGEALFMAILSMAHVLELTVVAEGVETTEQLRILQELSCNEVQGYLISRPVPASEVPRLMMKRFLLPEVASQVSESHSTQTDSLSE